MIKHLSRIAAIAALLVSGSGAMAFTGNIGPSASTAAGNAFYDDFYGPFYDGYWTAAGEYFFSTGPARPYVRDDGHHFSRVMTSGFRPVETASRDRVSDYTASR